MDILHTTPVRSWTYIHIVDDVTEQDHKSQIVDRDYLMISTAHGVVVYHRAPLPSYGVMGEIMHAVNKVSRPVYVLYTFKKRLSPFFEQLVHQGRFVQGTITNDEYKAFHEGRSPKTEEEIERLEDSMKTKLTTEWRNWPTIPDELKSP